MGLKDGLVKQILLVAIAFYGLPIFWWSYNGMDDEPGSEYYLTVRFLMSTGTLMTLMGMCYVAMPLDLVPDFIPIFGQIDDMIAKLVAGGGMMMMYMGYKFGTGETPGEFEMTVTAVSAAYNVIVPFAKEKVIPLIAPAIAAIAVPMKKAAGVVVGMAFEKANDPNVQANVINMANKAGEL